MIPLSERMPRNNVDQVFDIRVYLIRCRVPVRRMSVMVSLAKVSSKIVMDISANLIGEFASVQNIGFTGRTGQQEIVVGLDRLILG